MIDNPTREDLVDLIGNESGCCVSILMRTHDSGRETTQNPIRFKNLIKDAIERVRKQDSQLCKRLEELAQLEHDIDFWQHQSAGLAIYVCSDYEQRFKLSHRPEEAVYVGEEFLIRPLAAASCGGDNARALALSWDRARWFACDGHEAYEIENDSFPATKEDLIAETDAEPQLQFRTQGQQGRGGRSTAMFHGHGQGEDTIAAERELYLARVGKMVADAVYNTHRPLILLATEEVAGHFSSRSDIEAARVVHTSPDAIDDQELRSKVVTACQAVMQQSGEDLQQRLGTALANSQGSQDVQQIISEACNGRVETLLVSDAQTLRGRFDRERRQVDVTADGPTDLINLAVRETLQAGGSIARLPQQQQQSDSSHAVAAIYRF